MLSRLPVIGWVMGFGWIGWMVVLAMLVPLGCAPASQSDRLEGGRSVPAGRGGGKVVRQGYGIASGDVTHQSAVVWWRTDGPALVQVEWWPVVPGAAEQTATSPTTARQLPVQRTTVSEDYTAVVTLADLQPDTRYHYRVWTADVDEGGRFATVAQPSELGRFQTAPLPTEHREVRFMWSGDLGGQAQCRQGPHEYPIFDRARALQPLFLLFLGDLIYGDEGCVVPPNVAGSERAATTLDEFRAKHRYQRGAASLRRFLAEVSVWVMWDDHEVRNNFSGPFDPLMPVGRQALLEYWPIRRASEEPTRLYRSVRYGADLEVFLLDTRQYRSRNQDLDGPDKTMLGSAQLAWLLEGVARSTATWKVIASSVPLSHPTKASRIIPGNDSWARAADGTGFERELSVIVQALLSHDVRNVVWLSGDVHYTQAIAYDATGDGVPDFSEFIAGPLSAAPGRLPTLAPTFRPTILFEETGFNNFGVVTVTDQIFRVEIVDVGGVVRHHHTLVAY